MAIGQQHVPGLEYFSGQGVMSVGEKDSVTGLPISLTEVSDTNNVVINIETSTNTIMEGFTGLRTEVARYPTQTSVGVEISLQSFDDFSMAFGTQGNVTSQPAVTAQAINFTAVNLGATYPFEHIDLSAFQLQSSDTVTTFEEGKNYRIDGRAGSVHIFTDAEQTTLGAAANISAGDALLATLDAPANKLIQPLTEDRIQRWFRFDGLNRVRTNSPVILEVFNADFDPLSTIALWSESDHTVMPMAASGLFDAKAQARGESPYFRMRKL